MEMTMFFISSHKSPGSCSIVGLACTIFVMICKHVENLYTERCYCISAETSLKKGAALLYFVQNSFDMVKYEYD